MELYEKIGLALIIALSATCVYAGTILKQNYDEIEKLRGLNVELGQAILLQADAAKAEGVLLRSIVEACVKGGFFQAGKRIYFCADKATIQQLKQFSKPPI